MNHRFQVTVPRTYILFVKVDIYTTVLFCIEVQKMRKRLIATLALLETLKRLIATLALLGTLKRLIATLTPLETLKHLHALYRFFFHGNIN